MRRTISIIAATAAAIALAELMLQTPLYRWLQPEILTPAEGAVVSPPLLVQWDGPPRLAVSLVSDGSPARDLGVRQSPFELSAEELPTPGAYRLQARLPVFGALVQAVRRFAVAAPATAPSAPTHSDARLSQLNAAYDSLQSAQEQTQAENTALYEENAGLRQENAILLQELDRMSKANDELTARATAGEERQGQLTQENRTLRDQVTALQWRLTAALTCNVWGYYTYPHPQTIPATRRIIIVTDPQANVFRTEADCDGFRRTDPTTASRCFCVGTPLAAQ